MEDAASSLIHGSLETSFCFPSYCRTPHYFSNLQQIASRGMILTQREFNRKEVISTTITRQQRKAQLLTSIVIHSIEELHGQAILEKHIKREPSQLM